MGCDRIRSPHGGLGRLGRTVYNRSASLRRESIYSFADVRSMIDDVMPCNRPVSRKSEKKAAAAAAAAAEAHPDATVKETVAKVRRSCLCCG